MRTKEINNLQDKIRDLAIMYARDKNNQKEFVGRTFIDYESDGEINKSTIKSKNGKVFFHSFGYDHSVVSALTSAYFPTILEFARTFMPIKHSIHDLIHDWREMIYTFMSTQPSTDLEGDEMDLSSTEEKCICYGFDPEGIVNTDGEVIEYPDLDNYFLYRAFWSYITYMYW